MITTRTLMWSQPRLIMMKRRRDHKNRSDPMVDQYRQSALLGRVRNWVKVT